MTKTEQYKRAAEQRHEDADDAKVTPPRLTWHRESEIKELPDDGDVTTRLYDALTTWLRGAVIHGPRSVSSRRRALNTESADYSFS